MKGGEKVEAENIKTESFINTAPKKEKNKISKKDFIEKLESFIKKESSEEGDSSEIIEEVSELVDQLESSENDLDLDDEEDFIPIINLHWMNVKNIETESSNKKSLKKIVQSNNLLENSESLFTEIQNILLENEEGIDLELDTELKNNFLNLVEKSGLDGDSVDEQAITEIVSEFKALENESITEIKTILNNYIHSEIEKQEKDLESEEFSLKKLTGDSHSAEEEKISIEFKNKKIDLSTKDLEKIVQLDDSEEITLVEDKLPEELLEEIDLSEEGLEKIIQSDKLEEVFELPQKK